MNCKQFCLSLALTLCLGLTACGGESTPPSTDEDAATTTLTSASAETTSTATTTAATTSTATTTAALTTSATVPADTSQTVASPLADVSIVKIDLYDTQLFQMEEAVFVRSLAETATVEDVTRRLSAAGWEYFPNQDQWVKYEPLFAEWALVLTDTEGKQHVLHLLDETVGWASLGTFDGELSYTDVIAEAKTHDKEGIDDFTRYRIDDDTLTYLLSLFQ